MTLKICGYMFLPNLGSSTSRRDIWIPARRAAKSDPESERESALKAGA